MRYTKDNKYDMQIYPIMMKYNLYIIFKPLNITVSSISFYVIEHNAGYDHLADQYDKSIFINTH